MNNKMSREDFIKLLEDNIYGDLSIITMNGTTIASIYYLDVRVDEDDENMIYLIVSHSSEESVYINYNAVKCVRSFDDCIEITV